MKDKKLDQDQQGQALIELMVLLPVLLIFMAAVLPMITISKVAPWLDERLTLRHFLPNDEQVHDLLNHTHETDLLPSYFKKEVLEEDTQNKKRNSSSAITFLTFPGEMIRKITALEMPRDDHWYEAVLGMNRDQAHKTSRSLAMVKVPHMSEAEVVERIKQISTVGSASTIAAVLCKTGLKLYHINLNALPESEQKEQRR